MRHKRALANLDQDIRDHIDRETRENIERGMSPEDARYAAVRKFGNVAVAMEDTRHVWIPLWFERLRQDAHYGIRMLRRNPGFTLTVVLTLALGIGVNTAIFSLFNVFLQPVAVKDPGSIVNVDWGGSEQRWLSFHEYMDLRLGVQSLSAVIARADRTVLLAAQTAVEAPERVTAAFVSDNYLSTLGAGVLFGRSFLPEENSAIVSQPVALLSHRLWQQRFGGDTSLVGRPIQLGETTFTVIGVTASGFAGLERTPPGVWLPLASRRQFTDDGESDLFGGAGPRWLLISGRLAPGRTLDDARAESAVVANRSMRQTVDTANKTRLRLTPGSTVGARRNFAPIMGIVLAATMMVLLIACANIANLVLARGAARKTEFGVRLAIGASHSRLIGQLLTESVLLAVLGGFTGLLLAWWSVKALATTLFARFGVNSGETGMYLDWRVLAFTAVLSVVTAFVFGVVPALRAIQGDLVLSVTKAGASVCGERGHVTLRQMLIVAEVAVCFVLLSAGGLLLRGLTELDAVAPGFDPTRVLVVEPRLDLLRYDETRAQEFHHELAARVTAVAGVEMLTRAASVPLAGMARRPIELDTGGKRTNQVLRAFRNAVAPNYFEAFQIPILRGRGFTEEDARAGGDVVVVSASTSQRLWPNQEPIGQRLRPEPGAPFAEVVGVAQDVQVLLDGQDPLFLYIPIQTWAGTTLLVRTSGDLRSVKDRLMAAARSIDPKVLVQIDSVADMVAASNTAGAARAASTLATCLGILALVLAGVGLYGVMACTVAERTGEIAIRIALGANHLRVQGLVIRQGLRLVLIGTVIGIVAGANVAGLFSSLLFGISPFDPLAYTGVSAFLFAVALLATWLPARRASSVDPMMALRSN